MGESLHGVSPFPHEIFSASRSAFVLLLLSQCVTAFQFLPVPVRLQTRSRCTGGGRAASNLCHAASASRREREATALQCKSGAGEERVVIVGGGISGLACAVELQERGIPFVVSSAAMLMTF